MEEDNAFKSIIKTLDYSTIELNDADLNEALEKPEEIIRNIQVLLLNNCANIKFAFDGITTTETEATATSSSSHEFQEDQDDEDFEDSEDQGQGQEVNFNFNSSYRQLNILKYKKNLRILDMSNNQIQNIPWWLLNKFRKLKILVLKNNMLSDFSFAYFHIPKKLDFYGDSLIELNLSGNRIESVPWEIYKLTNLINLNLGGNRIKEISKDIKNLKNLEILYLGGNLLKNIPSEVGELKSLRILVLCDNKLEKLPLTISNLKNLKSLLLHKNYLTTLPIGLIKLRNLLELSLRDNPLVLRFVRDLTFTPPTLLELSGRVMKLNKIPYNSATIPKTLVEYLNCAQRCLNPKCKGVYFDTCVEHIKFVDFCGKYRLPLLQYLCSHKCCTKCTPTYNSSSSDSESENNNYYYNNNDADINKIKRVLLG